MKILAQLGLCCLLAAAAFGQRGMGHGGGGFTGHVGGVGRGGFPGGFGHRGFIGGFSHRGFVGGFGAGGFFGRGVGHPGFRVRAGTLGFAARGFGAGGFASFGFPLFVGGGWGSYDPAFDPFYASYLPAYGAPYPYAANPSVTVVVPYAAAPPPATVALAPVRPVLHEYRRPEDYGLPETAPGTSVIYLIALKDSVIRAALAYWVEGGTLHYIGMDHGENRVPLGTVDREFSRRLNRERNVPFRLPE